jgi:hypothetical protein
MKEPQNTIKRRFEKRNLPNLLVRKFLTEYGYDHGPVVARAIVEDILATIERCCPENIPPKTVVWLAVRREWHGQRKGLDVTDLVPVQLCLVTEEEVGLLANPTLRSTRRAYQAFNRARYARWCFEAYEQGGVLTLLDLSLLGGFSQQYAGERLQEYEKETGTVVPTRGTVHDLGRSVTHKAEVIRRWLRNESPAQIARGLGHSQSAVDRYIADFQKVRLLAGKFPVTDLPTLVGLSKDLVKQYVALLRLYEPDLVLYSESEPDAIASSDEPVPAPVGGTTARRADRVKGDQRESAAALDTGEHLATVEQVQEQAAC